ncbi:uncharacterized protein LOC111622819 [Centruroides sculpturatus]|uniref:uncharacterized protein LOC111622819 n=1 Tax=Centruroides sculpturatus TaxID=218467 RepID=UPI000C6C9BD9|nr:uncharacterized protein LOC111622819 [Centruroides sculpturatus]
MFPLTPPEVLKQTQEERKGTKHHRSPSDPGVKYPKLEHYFKRQSPPDSDREELLTLRQYLETTLNAVMMQLKYKLEQQHQLPLDDVASPNIFDVRRSKDLKVDTAGRQFLCWLIEHDFILLNGRTKGDFPGELTFLSKVGSSVIDFIVVSQNLVHKVESLCVGSLSSSDHFPVELQLSAGNRFSFVDGLCPTKTRYVWNDSKVELFGDAVSLSFRNINFDSVSVDDLYGIILSELCSILRRLNVLIECVEPYRRIRPPWFDRSCYIQKRARNIALGRSNSQADLASFLNLKRQYNSLIRAKKRKDLCNYALQMDGIRDSKTVWYRIGRFRRVRRILDQEISLADWFIYYQQLFSLNTPNLPPILSLPMASFVVDPNLDLPISDTEVNTALQKMRIRSTPGVDNVSPSLIVYSKETLVPYLAKLFNRVYDTARIPNSWLEVKIKVIHKKGPLDDPANFRPISLLPVVRKIFTSILAYRLCIWLKERNLIQLVQFAFQPRKSTLSNILILYSIICRQLSKKRQCLLAAFIDYKKAFDSVVLNILLFKLKMLGISDKFIDIIQCLFSGLKTRVSTSAGSTDAFSLEKGLPQDDSLSPILFICYVNDMVQVFDDLSKDSISLGNYEVHLLQFADDTVVLSTTPIYLQRKLDRLYNYSSNLGLRINLSKSKIIIFRHGGRLKKADKFFLNGKGVSIVNEVIYLGIRLSATTSFQNYISYVKGKAFSKINVITEILRRVKNSHMALCKKLVASLFTSSWSYSLPFRKPFCFEGIDSIELMFFRRLFGHERSIPSYAIRYELGLEFPRKHFVKLTLNFLRNIISDPSSLECEAYSTLKKFSPKRSLKFCWFTKLENLFNRIGISLSLIDSSPDVLKYYADTILQEFDNLFLREEGDRILNAKYHLWYPEILDNSRCFYIYYQQLPFIVKKR